MTVKAEGFGTLDKALTDIMNSYFDDDEEEDWTAPVEWESRRREVSYLVCCEQGHETVRTYGGDPGLVVWVQCETCGAIYQARIPGKYRGRKVRQSTQRKRDAIFDIFAESGPTMTVRQVYYALAVRRFVPKTHDGYRQAGYQLTALRRLEIMPYGWIADNTRWQIKPTTYTGLESAMQIWHDAYRRDLWARQGVHVEVWVEKDALAGVIAPVTRRYDVPLFVARGFSSMTFAYDAAEAIKEIGKPTYIYHFGDFDPSGVSAALTLKEELGRHGARAQFRRMAVTRDQVEAMDLPTLAVNRKDPRAGTWQHPYVCELDALPVKELRSLVESSIVQHIDHAQLEQTRKAESIEKTTFDEMRRYFVQERNNGDVMRAAL